MVDMETIDGYLDLTAKVCEDVTLHGQWGTLISETHVSAALPYDKEVFLPQILLADDHVQDFNAWFLSEGDEGYELFEEGKTYVLQLILTAEEGYGFARVGTESETKVWINGAPAETSMIWDGEWAGKLEARLPCVAGVLSDVLTLPHDLTTIQEEAFTFTDAQVVVVPEGVTRIGPRAFGDCPRLQRVYLPDSLVEISDDAFQGCPSSLMLETQKTQTKSWARTVGILVHRYPAGY